MTQKNRCLDQWRDKCNSLGMTKGVLNFQGWDIKRKEEKLRIELCEFFADHTVTGLIILNEEQLSYTIDKKQHYCNIDYYNEYKNGYGKASKFTVTYRLIPKKKWRS